MALNSEPRHLHFGRARAVLSRVYPPARVKETNRITKAYQALVGLAVLCHGDQRPRRPRFLAARAIPRVSCAWSTRRPSYSPIAAVTVASTACATSISRSASPHLIFLIPGVGETLRIMRTPRHVSTDPGCARLRHRRQGAALRARDRDPSKCSSNAPRRCVRAQIVGPVDLRRTRRPCRPPAKSWPRSAAPRSAATSTIASRASADEETIC